MGAASPTSYIPQAVQLCPLAPRKEGGLGKAVRFVFLASFQSGFFERKFGLQFKNFLRIRDSGFGKIKNRDFAYYDHYLQWLKS